MLVAYKQSSPVDGADMIDVRFPTALQLMMSLMLAEKEGVALVSSAQLADGLGANSSLIRNLLVPLVRQGLVVSSRGKNGGVSLGRPPDGITFREIYEAVTAGKTLFSQRTGYPRRCIVSDNFDAYFQGLVEEADNMLLGLLGGRTLAQGYSDLESLNLTAGRTRKQRPPTFAGKEKKAR